MPLPNFFIIGAPKAGTSALHLTLAQHPDVYMSPVKEPMFFAFEGEPRLHPGPAGSLMRRRAVWRAPDYVQLFAGVKQERAIGEASVVYLRSPIAASRIHANVPEARIVVVLRDPAERAWSHFWFSVANGSEPATRLEDALAQEWRGEREEWTSELRHWENGLYGAQLARYFERFRPDQIQIHLYEDWLHRPDAVLRDLCGFLDVDPDEPLPVLQANTTRLHRSSRLGAWAAREVPGVARATLRRADVRWNARNPPPLASETRRMMTERYQADGSHLQRQVDKDVSRWYARE